MDVGIPDQPEWKAEFFQIAYRIARPAASTIQFSSTSIKGERPLGKEKCKNRRAGLRERMEPPEKFLRRINKLSIEVSQQTRRVDRKKGANAF